MKTLIIHGRQPAIGRAELESIHGADKMRRAGPQATLLDIEPKEINFMRLGGMVKFCKVLTTLDTTKWDDVEKFLLDVVPGHFSALPEGKLKIGLSVYGLNTSPKRIHATALELKKVGKKTGKSVRVIPNKSLSLNAAQVLHNKLTQKLGWELVFVRDEDKTIVAQSIAVQDIDRYAERDHQRPYRDAKVGMLPPKLAQTIINLAASNTPISNEHVILDPFCGTGVILQEANLMGFTNLYGSDKDKRMVEYTDKNLEWLLRKFNAGHTVALEVDDATTAEFTHEFSAIAAETYLGKPLSTLPEPETLTKIVNECDYLHEKFLKNVTRQTKPGFRMCLAVPAWKTKNGFKHLKTLDKLPKLGYNRVTFAHTGNEELIYHRPDQIVARELVVLSRR